ncbi:hypothetical protein Scep_014629 [Stephania cephalantha]|uniref:Uncharacterized protein n=1 Tax=Stephania cephalantha TaxID=152367 RepID=A0AAP0P0K4_9MAGN
MLHSERLFQVLCLSRTYIFFVFDHFPYLYFLYHLYFLISRMHNMPSSFQASHHSSHADTPSRHDTPLYTPSVPLNEFGTPHTPSVPPNMTFEAMEAFPFDTAPTSSRHFHASPIMMNLSGSTSTQDGGMRDNDDIQPRRCSKSG